MPTDPTTGLVILPARFSVALGTLAAQTGIDLVTAYATATTKTFLMKQLMYNIHMDTRGVDGAGTVAIVLCRGDITPAEAITIINNTLEDPTDASNWDEYGQSAAVMWQSLRLISDLSGSTAIGGDQHTLTEKISIGGKNGIPFSQEGGWRLFAYNYTAGSFITGALLQGLVQFSGIWLDD